MVEGNEKVQQHELKNSAPLLRQKITNSQKLHTSSFSSSISLTLSFNILNTSFSPPSTLLHRCSPSTYISLTSRPPPQLLVVKAHPTCRGKSWWMGGVSVGAEVFDDESILSLWAICIFSLWIMNLDQTRSHLTQTRNRYRIPNGNIQVRSGGEENRALVSLQYGRGWCSQENTRRCNDEEIRNQTL